MRTKLLVVYDALLSRFGPQHWWPGGSPWEIAVGAMLTQQVSWSNVEKAIASLKSEGVLDIGQMICANPDKIRQLIKPAGFFNQKTERLLGFARYVAKRHGIIEKMLLGSTLDVRAELLGLKGIGPETADSILLYAGGHASFVVDAYTKRLAKCLGLPNPDNYYGLKTQFESELPRDVQLYNEYHALIVRLGKEHCKTKPLCDKCPVKTVTK